MAVAAHRIIGLDVARGLAILGMFAAHTVDTPAWSWDDPGTWGDIVNGRSSILFAVLAGVSIAMLSGRRTPLDGLPLLQARMRILIRAVLVFAIGGLLAVLGSGIAVILEYYAMLFVLSLPFLRWRPKPLIIAAAIMAFAGPILSNAILGAIVAVEVATEPVIPMESAFVTFFATGFYPALVWIAFLFAGLAVGRMAIESVRVQGWLVAVGAALAVLGYGLGSLLAPLAGPLAQAMIPSGSESSIAQLFFPPALLTTLPHSGSPFEVIGSTGFALVVIGLCLLATRADWVRIALTPLSSMGQMALTIYAAQIIAFWIVVVSTGERPDSWLVFGVFAVASAVVAVLWRAFLGQGPLERLLSRVSKRVADVTPRVRPSAGAAAALLESPVRPGEGASGPVIDNVHNEEHHPNG